MAALGGYISALFAAAPTTTATTSDSEPAGDLSGEDDTGDAATTTTNTSGTRRSPATTRVAATTDLPTTTVTTFNAVATTTAAVAANVDNGGFPTNGAGVAVAEGQTEAQTAAEATTTTTTAPPATTQITTQTPVAVTITTPAAVVQNTTTPAPLVQSTTTPAQALTTSAAVVQTTTQAPAVAVTTEAEQTTTAAGVEPTTTQDDSGAGATPSPEAQPATTTEEEDTQAIATQTTLQDSPNVAVPTPTPSPTVAQGTTSTGNVTWTTTNGLIATEQTQPTTVIVTSSSAVVQTSSVAVVLTQTLVTDSSTILALSTSYSNSIATSYSAYTQTTVAVPTVGTTSSQKNASPTHKTIKVALGVAIPVAALLLGVAVFFLWRIRKRAGQKWDMVDADMFEHNSDDERSSPPSAAGPGAAWLARVASINSARAHTPLPSTPRQPMAEVPHGEDEDSWLVGRPRESPTGAQVVNGRASLSMYSQATAPEPFTIPHFDPFSDSAAPPVPHIPSYYLADQGEDALESVDETHSAALPVLPAQEELPAIVQAPISFYPFTMPQPGAAQPQQGGDVRRSTSSRSVRSGALGEAVRNFVGEGE